MQPSLLQRKCGCLSAYFTQSRKCSDPFPVSAQRLHQSHRRNPLYFRRRRSCRLIRRFFKLRLVGESFRVSAPSGTQRREGESDSQGLLKLVPLRTGCRHQSACLSRGLVAAMNRVRQSLTTSQWHFFDCTAEAEGVGPPRACASAGFKPAAVSQSACASRNPVAPTTGPSRPSSGARRICTAIS